MENVLELKNKSALVCGATQGIGLATAQLFARLGCSVIAVARNSEKLKTTMDELNLIFPAGRHRFIAGDLEDTQFIINSVQDTLNSMGDPIEIYVNNSGGPQMGTLDQVDSADFVKALNSHLLTPHSLTKLLLPGMKASGYGRIINVLSTSVRAPIPNLGVSNTTRSAVAAWAKTLANEVAAFGITVNSVLPGCIDTPRSKAFHLFLAEKNGRTLEEERETWIKSIPARRIGEAEEVAQVIGFLASPLASYVNGTLIPVDGGRTLTL